MINYYQLENCVESTGYIISRRELIASTQTAQYVLVLLMTLTARLKTFDFLL